MEFILSSGWITLLLASLLGFFVVRALLIRSKNFPPGPIGLPFLGYFPFLMMSARPEKMLRDLGNKYGDIMSLNMFGLNTIHLNSFETIRECFANEAFSGRPKVFIRAQTITNTMGIVPSEGETCKIHRRFALQTLRDFGFGKSSLETRIQETAGDINQELENSKEKPVDIKDAVENATANVICSLVFDQHFKVDDPIFKKFTDNLRRLVLDVPMLAACINGPIIERLPLEHLPTLKAFMETNKAFEEVIRELVKEHQEAFDPNFLRDYVDVFLDEMRKNELSGDAEKNTFTIDRLIGVTFDLFAAGTETTASSIYWTLWILMTRPEIQRKIHLEIDEMIGRERMPSATDRPNMPYLEATINEVQRFASIVPLGLFHRNPVEVQFRNYIIPEGSIIIANFFAVHNDPKYWSEPEKFDPTRFLTSEGKLNKKDSFLPFSVGKRVCLGETLARTELFIFLVSILQRFVIVPPDGNTDIPLKFKTGIVRTLEPYNLCALAR